MVTIRSKAKRIARYGSVENGCFHLIYNNFSDKDELQVTIEYKGEKRNVYYNNLDLTDLECRGLESIMELVINNMDSIDEMIECLNDYMEI